ncbi:hypothetical protein D3C74_416000 [compost metagenome]
MGYCQSTYPEINNYQGFVISLNTQYSPRLALYNLRSGKEDIAKISKKLFYENELEEGSLIADVRAEKRNKKKRNEDGKYIDLPEKEIWITNFRVIK